MTETEQIKGTMLLERESAQRTAEANAKRIAELEAQVETQKTQLGIATRGAGIPPEVEADIPWRLRGGTLTLPQATECAMRQWDHNLKLINERAAAEAAKASVFTHVPVTPIPVTEPIPTQAVKTSTPAAAPVAGAKRG